MYEPKLKEIHPKYTPAVRAMISAELERVSAPDSFGASHGSAATGPRGKEAWEQVMRCKEEWSYEDWEDFYEAITSAFEKIAARRQPPSEKSSNGLAKTLTNTTDAA